MVRWGSNIAFERDRFWLGKGSVLAREASNRSEIRFSGRIRGFSKGKKGRNGVGNGSVAERLVWVEM